MADSLVSPIAAPAPQTAWSHRPNTAIERAEVLRFLQLYGPTLAHPALQATYAGAMVPTAASYEVALLGSADAHAKAVRTVATLDEAEVAFAETLRSWSTLVEALHGAEALKVTGPVFGDRTPAQFKSAPTADKLVRLPRLWELVAEVPELIGLPEAYASLQAAAATLAIAFADNEAALNTRAAAVAATAAATVEFDRQYGGLVRLIKLTAPTLVPALPRFRRVRRGKPVPATNAARVPSVEFPAPEAGSEDEPEAIEEPAPVTTGNAPSAEVDVPEPLPPEPTAEPIEEPTPDSP